MQSEIRAEIFRKIEKERLRQHNLWGEQNHPLIDVSELFNWQEAAELRKTSCEDRFGKGNITWSDILLEEVSEVFATNDPEEQITELIQTAAVCVQMIECIKRNRK